MSSQQRHFFPLKVLTQRIGSTSPERLPHATSQLVELLLLSKDSLAAQSSTRPKTAQDADIVVHKFKTQLSTLLQDKSSGARWTAIVLVKTWIGFGVQDALQDCGGWVRSMIGILRQKTEHSSVKKLAVLCLTKIFLALQEYPNLKREVVTPSLQPFITHCLTATCVSKDGVYRPRPSLPLLRTVLQSFITLLPWHPTIFRTFRQDLRSMLASLLAPTASTLGKTVESVEIQTVVPRSNQHLAQKLLALLPSCAPNNSTADEWAAALDAVLKHTNRTADEIFRSIKEEKAGAQSSSYQSKPRSAPNADVQGEVADLFQLPGWQGINAGIERALGCLEIIEAHIATTNPASLSLPIAEVWKVLDRFLLVFRPSAKYSPGVNSEIERDEREALWARLPELHLTAIRASVTLLRRLDRTALSISDILLGRLCLVLEHGSSSTDLRSTIYQAATYIMTLAGASMSRKEVKGILPLLQHACGDVDVPKSQTGSAGIENQKQMGSGALLTQQEGKENRSAQWQQRAEIVSFSAVRVLGAVLATIRSDYIPIATRAAVDRTLILAQERPAMLTSVLNPPKQSHEQRQISSILPFLARAHAEHNSVETLLRPRLPPIRADELPEDETSEDELSDDQMTDAESSKIVNQNSRLELTTGERTKVPAAAPEKPLTNSKISSVSYRHINDGPISPKRARHDSQEQSLLPIGQEQLPEAKKLRMESPADRNIEESGGNVTPITHDVLSSKKLDEATIPARILPSHGADESKEDETSERSMTPDFVLPDDLGASTEEEDDEEEGEGNVS